MGLILIFVKEGLWIVEGFIGLLVACVPLFPIIFLVSRGLFVRLFPGKLAAYTLLAFGLAWLCAVLALAFVIFNGPTNFSLLTLKLNSTDTTPIFGFLADRLSLVIILLVTTVSGIVHLYSIRAMQEEKHFPRYFTLLSLVTVEVLLVVLANNLLMLAVFWILKGFTLTFLLGHYQERAASWNAALTKLRIDLVGDTAIIIAVILVWNLFGTFDLQTITRIVTDAPETVAGFQLTLLTSLIFIATMTKSAQFPLHRWLPQSIEAPTPVSALMHAGLINAGGFLFIRLSPLFVASPFTMGLAIVIGGFTTFYGTLIMLTRSDVKGMLVYSTMGQMGFMMLECGLGAFALAILHIIAHGLYKATLFLSSGSVIQRRAAHELLAPANAHSVQPFSRVGFLGASLFAALILVVAPVTLGFSVSGQGILLAFAWITLVSALPKLARLPIVALYVGLIGIVIAYLAGTHAIEQFFSPVIAASPILDTRIVLFVSGLLIISGAASVLFQTSTRPLWFNRFLRKLYVRLLFTGYDR